MIPYFLGETQPVINRFNKFLWNVIILWFPTVFPQPVIEHDTDHYTADKGVDKAVFIILSALTEKQAFFSQTHKQRLPDEVPLEYFSPETWQKIMEAARM